MSWDAFNESTDLVQQVEEYQKRFGVLPESVHADQIYRTKISRSLTISLVLRSHRHKGLKLTGVGGTCDQRQLKVPF